ncbi:BppU family phage baseplate upper protein [Bacillus cereus]|uniref:BppU family phage baseplate upper protein n=1 Tax=Bacillus cereus TaxID=1396 RepID=A0AAW5L1B4_BACCE|nr:BppU family phage baseplate upper protein [Bacillus cereus]MCQ6288067.1 BppU family phage baseplate upper protein [Bacillus cereus]MCQ6317145.1 BppU family phage baseplate upper protein [Bacillus cereus]MCQ6328049.1 BppU family phage baseplate upper protein [Bacillus cereus]MCQ6385353.1 BppU family phage baseplate upper protein [Bacillus cereus]
MTFKTYEVNVDLVSDASTTPTIRFSQNDRNSAKLLLTITNKGVELDLSQAKAVRISFEKSDGTRVFQNDCQPINVLKGKYQILLKTQTLSSVGNVIAQIHIEEEDRMIDTQKFLFVVNESLASDGAVESANEFTIIQKAIEAGKKLEGVDLTTITEFLPNQRDFIALLRNHNTSSNMYTRIVGDRTLDILIPLRGNKVAHYTLRKDTKDDYVKLEDCAISNLNVVPQKVNAINYKSDTGAMQKANPPNYYTTTVGDTFTFTFDGTGFDFQHFTDNRGGLWEFKVDGTVVKTISTHINAVPTNELKVNYGIRPVARGLAKGTHTVIATFKGDDPANAPASGANTARGWVKNDSGYAQAAEAHKTALLYDDLLHPVKEIDLLIPFSNKEFAFRMKPNGSSVNAEWIPEHSAATVFKTTQKMYVDDKEIISWAADATVKEVQMVRVVQSMKGFHPSDLTNALCEIYSVHTVTNQGVTFDIKIKWLKDTFIEDGYIAMLPGSRPFVEKLVDATGQSLDTIASDNSFNDIPNGEKITSYAMFNTTGTDYVVAMKINHIHASLRKGQTGRRHPLVWLQHRDATLQKLYPQVYKNCVAKVNETHSFSATYSIGELPLAAQLLM